MVLHALDGRIRIRVPSVKNRPDLALQVERLLLHYRGVTKVKANPTTANVLVIFDTQKVTDKFLMHVLQEFGFVEDLLLRPASRPVTQSSKLGAIVAQNVFMTATELALRGLICALV